MTVSEDVGAAISRLNQSIAAYSDFQQRITENQAKYSEVDFREKTKNEEYATEMLIAIRLGRKAGSLSYEEYVFYTSYYVENLIFDRRWTAGQYNQHLDPISQQMRQIEREHGLTHDECWPIGEGPEEYERLNREYETILDTQKIATYRELGEDELADLIESDPVRFDEIREVGRKAIVEVIPETDRLRALLARYKKEAMASSKAGAFYGACALIGACLETTLLLLCHLYSGKAEETRVSLPADRKPRSSDPNDWSLNHLIHIAGASGWLPNLKMEDVELDTEGWVHLIRGLRNLLHPGNHLDVKPKGQISSQEFEDSFAVYTIVEALFDRLEKQPIDTPATTP